MDNESIHGESEFYLYPEEQDKYGLFVFFYITRDITLSIIFLLHGRKTTGFLQEPKIFFYVEEKKEIRYSPAGSVWIEKDCARGLENVFKTSDTVFLYPDRAAGE